MKHLLVSFIALGFIVSGCAHKEEAKADSVTPVAADAKDCCKGKDCTCDHHEKGKCPECEKAGTDCERCKKAHSGCKDCAEKSSGCKDCKDKSASKAHKHGKKK